MCTPSTFTAISTVTVSNPACTPTGVAIHRRGLAQIGQVKKNAPIFPPGFTGYPIEAISSACESLSLLPTATATVSETASIAAVSYLPLAICYVPGHLYMLHRPRRSRPPKQPLSALAQLAHPMVGLALLTGPTSAVVRAASVSAEFVTALPPRSSWREHGRRGRLGH